MRVLVATSIAALILFPPSISIAKKVSAKKKAVAKTVSIQDIIARTMNQGKDWTLQDPRASNLGYAGAQPAKKLVVGTISDGSELSSIIVLDNDKAPTGIIFSTTKADIVDNKPVAIDGYSYRTDLTGKLVSAIWAHGKVEDVVQDKVNIKSPAEAAKFNKTVSSFLTHTAFKGK